MEKKGNMIEVLGVPDVAPAERTCAKLQLYFLKTRHGGGDVERVLYPCYQPGQAFIIFKKPEIAARVLQRSPHVLEMNNQKYHLTVKAPEHTEVDLPVEATVNLSTFPDEAEVRRILRSHGFELTDLSGDQVRVKGSFLKLKAVKASLEQILQAQTKTDIRPVPTVSSGAISKHYNSNSLMSNGGRGRDKPPHASPSSPTTSSSWAPFKHLTVRGSIRSRRESFVVDADVFSYADRLRKRDIETILVSHDVRMDVREVGDSCNITLLGNGSRKAVGKLQSLLNDLNKSLRTQEVPLKHVDHDGQALLERIRKDKNVYNLVLVCQKNDHLHLIGPSGESYELQQRLLGRTADQSGRTGRTSYRSSSRRSSSLPPLSRKHTERDSGANANPSPAGAAGYSPPHYQDDKQKAAEAKQAFGRGGWKRRSHSETHDKTRAQRVNEQETESRRPPPRSAKKFFMELINFKDIKKKFKNMKK